MAVWHIVVLYLAIFALLQFVVYRYLRGNNDGRPTGLGSATNPESGTPDDQRADLSRARESAGTAEMDDAARFCPQCGARNEAEQSFTFCRNCAGPLGR